eukprot:6878230-Alexandrium_andersonii.AAC.1
MPGDPPFDEQPAHTVSPSCASDCIVVTMPDPVPTAKGNDTMTCCNSFEVRSGVQMRKLNKVSERVRTSARRARRPSRITLRPQ